MEKKMGSGIQAGKIKIPDRRVEIPETERE